MSSEADETAVDFCLTFGAFLLYLLLVAHFYVGVWNSEKNERSIKTALWLEVFCGAFVAGTHLAADGLLVWRCYVIWIGNLWVGLAPLLPYTAAAGVGIVNVVSNALCTSRDMTNMVCRNDGVTVHRGLYYLVATSVNLSATVLICVRLLRVKQEMNRALGSSIPTTERVWASAVPYTRVTMLLMESALPFTLLGIAAAILTFVNSDSAQKAQIFTNRMWTMASGLTSQVITYRVITGISWVSSLVGDRERLSHPIYFVRSDVTLSTGEVSDSCNNVP
ncbi:hypothetical protein BKA70DRAFT_1405255 [Coprinopsis sp. MPI-PUGE-AT-0042]|nr:hypothetical protein BKA70DRAFT_1405255 [Coprinopsis sp. MPI-PUGE-AT-0042]